MRTRTIRLTVIALCVCICTVLGCADDSGGDERAAGSDADTASQSTSDSGPRRDAAGDDTSTGDGGATDSGTDTDHGTDTEADRDADPDGDSDNAHMCPADTSCVVYSRNDINTEGSSGGFEGAVWFVDPTQPSQRINLSAEVGASGLVTEMRDEPSGRHILFVQGDSSGGSDVLYFADLAGPNAPTVAKVHEGNLYEFGFGPRGDYIWAVTGGVRDRVRTAPAETPIQWTGVSEESIDDDVNLRSWLRPRSNPISPDGKWAFFKTTYLPDRGNDQDDSFLAIARAPVDSNAGSLEYLVTTGDPNPVSFDGWAYVPPTNRILVETDSELFWMPAEPSASSTQITPLSLDSEPHRRFDRASIGPNGNKLALSLLSNAEANRDEGDVTLRFVDPSQPDTERGSATLNYGSVFETHWNADGSEVVVHVQQSGLSDQGSPKAWLVDTGTYQATDVSGTIPPNSFDITHEFGPDGKYYFSVLNQSESHSYGKHLYRVDLPGGTAERIDRSDLTRTDAFEFSSDGSYIFYKGQANYENSFNLYRAPIGDPGNTTLLSQKAMQKDIFVRHVHIVGAK